MVKNLLLSIILLFSLSCAKYESNISYVSVDYAFNGMLEEYKNTKYQYLNTRDTYPISIIFRSLRQDGFEGMCTRYSNGMLVIEIDPVAWYFGTIWDQRALFYHEMGHCDLGIWEHTEDITIMNSYGIWGNQLAANPDFYYRKLFIERK